MSRMLIAASPVEIEAKAEEAGMPQGAHNAARQLFHTLTNRLGEAVIALESTHETWPNHRFYFGPSDGDVRTLLGRLEVQPDLLDVSQNAPRPGRPVAGLFAQAQDGAYRGVLVGHTHRDGLLSLHEG